MVSTPGFAEVIVTVIAVEVPSQPALIVAGSIASLYV